MRAKFINEVQNFKKLTSEEEFKDKLFTNPNLEEIYKDITWGRKPISLDEIPTTDTYRNYELTNWIDSLPYAENYILKEPILDPLPDNLPRIFKCDGEDDEIYLVDTMGYDYARYITRLK